MKIYANELTLLDVREAVTLARNEHGQDIDIDGLEPIERTRRSRWRTACTLYCYSANGRYSTQRNVGRAATWTAWGYVIAEMYRRDPNAHIGWYKDANHFYTICQEQHNHVAQFMPERLAERDVTFLELLP